MANSFWHKRDGDYIAMDAHADNFHVDEDGNVFPVDLPTRKLTRDEYKAMARYETT